MGNIDHGLRRNAEAYIDPTAYEAIVAADLPRIGDIYTVWDKSQNRYKDYLIVSVGKKYCNAFYLANHRHYETDHEIVSRSIKYVDAGRMGYVFTDLLTDFVKRVPYSLFEELIEEFLRGLCVRPVVKRNGC